MKLQSLLLIVLEFEDVLLIVFAAGGADEDFVGRGGCFLLAELGEKDGLLALLFGIVDRINDVFGVHVYIIQ